MWVQPTITPVVLPDITPSESPAGTAPVPSTAAIRTDTELRKAEKMAFAINISISTNRSPKNETTRASGNVSMAIDPKFATIPHS